MDGVGLASAMISARMGEAQLAVAAKMLRMDTNAGQDVAKLIEASQQNLDRLANVSAGIGGNLDVSV